MAQINPRTFADAVRLGDNMYELILTNWGNRGARLDGWGGGWEKRNVSNSACMTRAHGGMVTPSVRIAARVSVHLPSASWMTCFPPGV